MRKNFAQVLKEAKVDIAKEYSRLYSIMFDEHTYEQLNAEFSKFTFAGTALSLEDFDETHGFFFEPQPKNFSIDDLVRLCEYSYNLLLEYESVHVPSIFDGISVGYILAHIDKVIEIIGYMKTNLDGFTVFVEKLPAAIAVAEILPKEVSYKVISYNHHSMKGNLEAKKNTLLKFDDLLEPQRKKLKNVWNSLEDDIFYAFNKLNLRHNNSDIKYVAQMSKTDLEGWYDELYQMCLLAFLRLEHIERQKKFDNLKQAIEKSKKEG